MNSETMFIAGFISLIYSIILLSAILNISGKVDKLAKSVPHSGALFNHELEQAQLAEYIGDKPDAIRHYLAAIFYAQKIKSNKAQKKFIEGAKARVIALGGNIPAGN